MYVVFFLLLFLFHWLFLSQYEHFNHCKELGAAQLVPTYKRCWEALGFASAPIDFTGVPFHAVRKMSGNTFHQGCFVAWQAFVLMKLRKK